MNDTRKCYFVLQKFTLAKHYTSGKFANNKRGKFKENTTKKQGNIKSLTTWHQVEKISSQGYTADLTFRDYFYFKIFLTEFSLQRKSLTKCSGVR